MVVWHGNTAFVPMSFRGGGVTDLGKTRKQLLGMQDVGHEMTNHLVPPPARYENRVINLTTIIVLIQIKYRTPPPVFFLIVA